MFTRNLFAVAQGSQGGHTDKSGIRIQSTKRMLNKLGLPCPKYESCNILFLGMLSCLYSYKRKACYRMELYMQE
jgi:hypothetical protein